MPATLPLPPCAWLTWPPAWRRRWRNYTRPVSTSAAPARQAWILTGPSGSGKATAVRALEAAGVSCTDNLPAALVGEFVAARGDALAVAVVDARHGDELASFDPHGARVLFLDAPDAVLVRRLADSRRPHPCARAGVGQAAVRAERELLSPLRAAADVIIDSGALSDAELASRVTEVILPEGGDRGRFSLTVSSFGFKYGPQAEADWLIDSRVLPNPFWEPALRPLTGLDRPVRDFLLSQPGTGELLERSTALLGWGLVEARERGRRALHVAAGCTGGRHRSVVVAAELAARLATPGVAVEVRHRDIHRPDPR